MTNFCWKSSDEASSSQMRNIVSTIQKAQNQIIRDTTNKLILIEGIAGSGKTSALLQRVAFLLYRNRKWLEMQKESCCFHPIICFLTIYPWSCLH